MFPVPSSQPLSFPKIADYWSREMNPSASSDELFLALLEAWWRGELIANGPERRDILKAIHVSKPPFVAFGHPEAPEPHIFESTDSTVEVQYLVPLPNLQPETWDDDNCVLAYRAIAEVWKSRPDIFELIYVSVRALELTEKEFAKWVAVRKWARPIFWAADESLVKSTPPPRSLTQAQAAALAQEYSEFERSEGQLPTQLGFGGYLKSYGVRGNRDKLRLAFKTLNGPAKRGRPANQK